MNDLAELISLPTVLNGSATEYSTEVFCRIMSVRMTEVYSAAAVGLRPDLQLFLADAWDYAGQPFAKVSGVLYKITRTYKKAMGIELTLSKPVGLRDDLETIKLVAGTTKTSVYAAVAYLQMSEVEDAGVYGLRRELHLIAAADKYTGQDLVEYDGKTYAVIRAYQEDNAVVDLYVEERVGLW